jgi:hypothetical protein
MKRTLSFGTWMFILALGVVVLTATLARLGNSRSPEPLVTGSQNFQVDATGTLPDLTSATFASGDALTGLGADWTFIQQEEYSADVTSTLPGIRPARRTLVKELAGTTELMIEEAVLLGQGEFVQTLKEQTTLGGREVYLLNESPHRYLVLVGKTSALLIEYSDHRAWKDPLPPAVASYVATVRVP